MIRTPQEFVNEARARSRERLDDEIEEHGRTVTQFAEENNRLRAERDRMRAELDAIRISYNELHSTLADKTRNYEDVIAYHERAEKYLRDLVGRFAKYAETYHALGVQGKQLVAEARAAVGEGETPTGKGVGR